MDRTWLVGRGITTSLALAQILVVLKADCIWKKDFLLSIQNKNLLRKLSSLEMPAYIFANSSQSAAGCVPIVMVMQLHSHLCAYFSWWVSWYRRNYRLGDPCFQGALDKSTRVQNIPVYFIDFSLLNSVLFYKRPENETHSQGPAGRLEPETWCESTQLSQIFCKMPPKEDQRKIYPPTINFYYRWVLFLICTQAFIIAVFTTSTCLQFPHWCFSPKYLDGPR